MANQEHVEILRQGKEKWNEWRENYPEIKPDLSEGEFRNKDFSGINFVNTNLALSSLSESNLTGSKLFGAILFHANIQNANLTGAKLFPGRIFYEKKLENDSPDYIHLYKSVNSAYESPFSIDIQGLTNLRGANLYNTNLSEANLELVDLSNSRLEKVNFTKSTLGWTMITNVDLSQTYGLDEVIHKGPSILDVISIYRSKGKIPKIFLRGVGLPENFIEYVDSLIGSAIQFYSCFISYSTGDQEFADRLHNDLQGNGVRCWFAPENIKGGRKLHDQIPEAIKIYDKLLLLLSENSMKSEWVKTEIYHARQEEIKTGKRKLFPLGLVEFDKIRSWSAFDADVGKDMAREIREYYIPDFSNWRNYNDYKSAFDRLLGDLKAS